MMAHSNQWAFVIAAYALTALGTIGLLAHSWMRMRGAEARAQNMRGAEARAQGMRGNSDAGHTQASQPTIVPGEPGSD